MIKSVGSSATGDEFLYNAHRSRVIHLDVNAATGTAPAQVPSGYAYKKIYAAGASMEVEYNYASASWHHVKARIYVPAPDGAAGAVEFTPAANNTVTEQADVYHYDHLGSIDCITTYVPPPPAGYAVDHAGKTTRYGYDAWGQRRNPATMSGPPTSATSAGGHTDLTMRGFTGHEMLDDIGLIHMNGRIYDPLLGRFLSADIMVQFPGDLQSYNRYSYVDNNPLSDTDSSGFAADQKETPEQKAEREAQEAATRKRVEDSALGTSAHDQILGNLHGEDANIAAGKAANDGAKKSQAASTTNSDNRLPGSEIKPATDQKIAQKQDETKTNPYALILVAQDIADSAAQETSGKSADEVRVINNNKGIVDEINMYKRQIDFRLKKLNIPERVTIKYFSSPAELKKLTLANVGDKTRFMSALAHGIEEKDGRVMSVAIGGKAVPTDDFKEAFEPFAKTQSPLIEVLPLYCDTVGVRHPDEIQTDLHRLLDNESPRR
ncbi:MAG TPA: RHS repeat-associated core domain-containing protein [Candidatus Didemnitutus sp.]|nr:RHS repeat-associated core domain-containing protein [Candidatus Didemnitutus sp.]